MRLRYVLLGLLAFAIALVVVLPAAWLKGLLPPQATCATLAGSVWRGQCSGLAIALPGSAPLRAETVGWTLRPLGLFRGQLAARVAIVAQDLQAEGEVRARPGGALRVEGFDAGGAIHHGRLAALPAGWTAHADARNLLLDYAGGQIRALGGTLQVRGLRDARGTSFGDFRLDFPPQETAPFRGALSSQGGPMKLQAQLKLNADQSWQLQGTVELQPGAPQGLAGALDQLAPADLNGRRQFSLEGTAR